MAWGERGIRRHGLALVAACAAAWCGASVLNFIAPRRGPTAPETASPELSAHLESVEPQAPQTPQARTSKAVYGVAALLAGASVRLCRERPASETALVRRAEVKSEVNYLALLTKGDLPKRIAIVIILLALARVGFYIPLYGFDVDATEELSSEKRPSTGGHISALQEYFGRQASQGGLGFVDQLFGGGLGRVSLFALGIGPYITSSIIFQILTTITPSLKALAAGEEGEAGREKYKNYIKIASFFFALIQGFGQSTALSPFVFDNGPIWSLQITLQFAIGSMITLFIADQITEQKLGNGSSLLVFSSIVANLPRTIGATAAKAADNDTGAAAAALFAATLLVTILGLVYVLQAERRIPILFAKRLQDEASGQGSADDAGQSYLPIKLNASGVLPLIFVGSLLSLPALAANYTKAPWLQSVAKSLLPGSDAYIPVNMVLIALFSYVSTFQVLDPKDMAQNLRKQAAAIPQVRPGRETEEYLREVLSRTSIFGAIILALLFVLPNLIELVTKLSTPNSFGGTSLLILVGLTKDTWRQLQAELLMQQYSTDVHPVEAIYLEDLAPKLHKLGYVEHLGPGFAAGGYGYGSWDNKGNEKSFKYQVLVGQTHHPDHLCGYGVNAWEPLEGHRKDEGLFLHDVLQQTKGVLYDLPIIEALLDVLHQESKQVKGRVNGGILIFLPGWDDIDRLLKRLTQVLPRRQFWILPLHSQIRLEQQKEVFQVPPRGVRKIILSTNIAETAITIDDIDTVIDCGRAKETSYDAFLRVPTLNTSWISKASASQRRGRAGRTKFWAMQSFDA
eukprot:s1346_g11.t1